MKEYSNKTVVHPKKSEAQGNARSKKQNGADTVATAITRPTTPKTASTPAAKEEALLKKAGFVEVVSNDAFTVFIRKALDSCTRTVEFVFVVVYRDGHVCPPQYCKMNQLTKIQTDIINMEGVTQELINGFGEFMRNNMDKLPSTALSSGKVPIKEAYQALIDYTRTYGVTDEVYIKEGYANIKKSLLDDIIKKLEIGYASLELRRALKIMGLLRTNAKSTGHFYEYKIGPYWFLSIKII